MPSPHDSLDRQLGELEVRVRHLEAEFQSFRGTLPREFRAAVREEFEAMHDVIRDLKTTASATQDGITRRDFWIAVGFLGAGIVCGALFPALKTLLQ